MLAGVVLANVASNTAAMMSRSAPMIVGNETSPGWAKRPAMVTGRARRVAASRVAMFSPERPG